MITTWVRDVNNNNLAIVFMLASHWLIIIIRWIWLAGILLYSYLVSFCICYAKFFFEDADRHELPGISDLNTIIDKRTKKWIMSYIHDEEHFINGFLEKLPSGRYRTLKYCGAWGKVCFLRSMIHSLIYIFKYITLLSVRIFTSS